MSKQSLMAEVVAEIQSCRKCGLWRTRRNPVPGEGNLDAALMFVGEAPGYWEDLRGRPFVGAAGRLLDQLLTKIGLSREMVFIANVLKCRPPGNRDPLPEEVEACTPFLDRQIEIVQPRIIVTLGRHSTRYILAKAGISIRGITQVRGRPYYVDLGFKVLVIPTFHPAAALYNPKYRSVLEEDFQLIREKLESLGNSWEDSPSRRGVP